MENHEPARCSCDDDTLCAVCREQRARIALIYGHTNREPNALAEENRQ